MHQKIVKDIHEMFNRDTNRNIFKNFIEYIRFPFFKNFEEDLIVNFKFPVTFITGANGQGKSSLLHSLYGAPEGYNISDYWYNTSIDTIKDIGENRHCFIYSFLTHKTKTNAEVIKTRIHKEGNPDYWETARPISKYKMLPLPEYANEEEATKTRWNPLKRKVYFLDFRYNLSAYDKYFYLTSITNNKTIQKKQDIIRTYSKKLKEAFEKEKVISYYKSVTSQPINLQINILNEISQILGKNYKEIKIIEHNFYDKRKGFAILYKIDDLKYSEAFAGSGESTIVKLVNDLMTVEDYSLILLDEPETSLHPAAQKKLMTFILKLIKEKKLQVIISTHSPDIIENMPKESIKILYENPENNKIKIRENVLHQNAFLHLGHSIKDKKVIIVEDNLAKLIIEKILEKNEDSKLFEVNYFPGGESRIKQEDMLVYSKEINSNHFIIFDGDIKKAKINILELSDNEKNEKHLEELIKSIVNTDIKFKTDSDVEKKSEQIINARLNFIKYHHDNVFYLPKNIPEEIIWDNDVLEKSILSKSQQQEIIKIEKDFKEKIRLFTKYEYGKDTNSEIESTHKKLIQFWINKAHEDFNEIVSILNQIKEK